MASISFIRRMERAAWAAVHSTWVTFLALCLAVLAGASAAGANDTATHFILYVHTNAFQLVCINIFAPLIRAALAASSSKGPS